MMDYVKTFCKGLLLIVASPIILPVALIWWIGQGSDTPSPHVTALQGNDKAD